MARDPGSVWSPLPEAGDPDGYVKTQFIVHSTGDNGTAAATRRFFAGATVNESTFIVGWGPDDPTLQIMDSTDNADANGSANQRGISVEVAGDGVAGYNAWQRSELIRLGRWARANHPIAARIIPSEPASGFGWHVMFGAPGPWAKGAKVCPGKQRISELKADIFPAIFAAKDKNPTTPGTTASEEDEPMITTVAPGGYAVIPLPKIPDGKKLFVRLAVDDSTRTGGTDDNPTYSPGCNVRVAVGWGLGKWHALPELDKQDGYTGWLINGEAYETELGGTDSALSVQHLGQRAALGVLLQIR